MPQLTEPAWQPIDQVQLTEKDASALCKGNLRPSEMTGYLLKLVQAHFYSAENISNPKLRTLLWKPKSEDEAEQSTIHIEPSYAYDVTHLQQRPAVYVSRGQVQVQRIALRDRALNHLSRRTGNHEGRDFLQLLQCRHQFICCAAKSETALEKLAEELFYMILEYGPSIAEDMRVGNFRVTGMTEVQPMPEDGDNFMCGVQLAWTTAHSWKLKPLAPILKSIGFTQPT